MDKKCNIEVPIENWSFESFEKLQAFLETFNNQAIMARRSLDDYTYIDYSKYFQVDPSTPYLDFCNKWSEIFRFDHVWPNKKVDKVEQVRKLQEDTKVELNELLSANFDRTDSRVSFLDKKLRFLGGVTRELVGNSRHEDFLKYFCNAGNKNLNELEQKLSKYLTKAEFDDYFGGSTQPVLVEKLSRFAYKVAYVSKGASRRFSLRLYRRDLRRLSRQVFTEAFKKHSNILGEDDWKLNDSNSCFHFTNYLKYKYVIKQYTNNYSFRSDYQ